MNWRMAAIVMTLLASAGGIQAADAVKAVLVIHGGAGTIQREKMSDEHERQYRAALTASLEAGHRALRREGGTSVDAVEAAVRVLEDSPLFNAGVGSVFTREGRIEMDASIMEGKQRKAGAVAAVSKVRNPVAAARLVMERSPHVLLVGEGAERFARSEGLAEANPLDFWTEPRWKALLDARREQTQPQPPQAGRVELPDSYFGTVGAVAVDREGNLAAATSTGGLTFKLPGRVGDSPIVGAGTYADNHTCAVSCTGQGEIFIRHLVAHSLAMLVKHRGLTVSEAAAETFKTLPQTPGGVGGLIALDCDGRFTMHFDTPGMYRGYATAAGQFNVELFGG